MYKNMVNLIYNNIIIIYLFFRHIFNNMKDFKNILNIENDYSVNFFISRIAGSYYLLFFRY